MPTEYRDEELLNRWISGELTAPEEAELERRARRDPDFAAAYAALTARPEAEHAAHLEAMRQRARPAAARRRLLPRYAAAAAAVLLLGLAVTFLPRLLSPGESTIAMERTESAVPAPADVNGERTAPASPPAPSPTTDEATREDDPPTPDATVPQARDASAGITEFAQPEEEIVTTDAEAADHSNARPVPPPAPALEAPAARPRLAAPSPALRKLNSFTVYGRVSNEDGEPIAGAAIRRIGLPTGPETDSTGQFTLPYDATLSQIEVSHPGYETETVDVFDTTAQLQISLTELSDEGARPVWRENADRALLGLPPAPRSRTEARPEEGYRALRDRLERERPDSLAGLRVRVSFQVNPDGSLSEFRFRGTDDRAVMDYVGNTLVETSTWQVVRGETPVRVYFTLRFE